METAFHEGRLTEAARLYDENAPSNSAGQAPLLRARVLLNTDAPAAIGFLQRLIAGQPAQRDLAEALTLLGDAYSRIGEYASADEKLEAALAIAEGLGDGDLIASVGYRLGRRFLAQGEAARARESLRLARAGRSAEARLDALHLESFVLSREERPRERALVLMELLRSIDPEKPEHMAHRATATHSLAALARELYLPEAVPEVERQLGGAPWPEEFAHNRFQAFKALGWAKALQGDYLNAFRFLKRSSELAPSDGWRVAAHCDRSYLARCIGQDVWARHELAEAEELAHRVDWRAAKGEETMALLLLAELFAEIDAPKASVYLARFIEIGDVKSPLSLMRRDPRLTARADYSIGVVERALGNRKRALQALQASFRVFSRLGYDWRAGRCAIVEYEITQKPETLETADEKLHHYSSSWLGVRARDLAAPALPLSLSPTQTKVFRMLCQGGSTDDIAARLGRSSHTVNAHIKALLKAFKVNSRSALVAQAVKLGLI
jgi:DNA-binding CsgD family transcriptional regulator